jgi:hypothetical protein
VVLQHLVMVELEEVEEVVLSRLLLLALVVEVP